MLIAVVVSLFIGFLLGIVSLVFYSKFKNRKKKHWSKGYKMLKYDSEIEEPPQENKQEESSSIFPPGMGF